MIHLRKFVCCERAVASIETAFLLPAGLLLIFAVIEISIMLIAQSALDIAADKGARLMRTGQAQTENIDLDTAFRDLACGEAVQGKRPLKILDCDGTLQVQVRSSHDPADVTIPQATAAGDSVIEVPGPGDFAVVRLYYEWSFLTPMLTSAMRAAGTNVTLRAGAAFRVENYAG